MKETLRSFKRRNNILRSRIIYPDLALDFPELLKEMHYSPEQARGNQYPDPHHSETTRYQRQEKILKVSISERHIASEKLLDQPQSFH